MSEALLFIVIMVVFLWAVAGICKRKDGVINDPEYTPEDDEL